MVGKRPIQFVLETPNQPRKRERMGPVYTVPVINKEEGWIKTPLKLHSKDGRRMLLQMAGNQGRQYLPTHAYDEHTDFTDKRWVAQSQAERWVEYSPKYTADGNFTLNGRVDRYPENKDWKKDLVFVQRAMAVNRNKTVPTRKEPTNNSAPVRLPSIKGLLNGVDSKLPSANYYTLVSHSVKLDEEEEDVGANADIIELDARLENKVDKTTLEKYRVEAVINHKSDKPESEWGVAEVYEEWKANVVEFYIRSPLTLLTQAFKLDLNKLSVGKYSFGGHPKCDKRVIQSSFGSYICPDVLGEIVSYGEEKTKTLTLVSGKDAGKPLVLSPGWTYEVNQVLMLQVTELNNLVLYDLTREFYRNVINQPPDLFYPYDPKIVFYGKLIGQKELLVNFFGKDIVFWVNDRSFPDLSLYYRDIVCRKQRIYQFKAIYIFRKVDDYYVIDFNCAYAVNLKVPEKMTINDIERAIYGGVNYNYF
ncbi:hypothetical protein HK103_002446 [Boothiomyces macroporosus]|uniref:Uncharacterized protein n=1 Tax=Boothiomyces macroporosus TaxID=261099 RepID=A0AAD5Y2J0_9FUNG|nr:hypothetical protein HK103_002446 [Boothiomyces macroporosus]